jgi:adhesin transport system outer membrane protein
MRGWRFVFMLGIAFWPLLASKAMAAAHLTLKEVTQKVVLTNPEVLAKWHAFKAAGGDADVARAGFFPRLDYTSGVGKESLKQPGLQENRYTRSGHTLTLNQMLYDGFATSSDVKRLDKARLVRYFELLDSAENAALEAGRVYYDLIRYRLLMYLAENNYVEHRASYEQLLRRAQSGAGRRVDVEHAASRLALAELNLNTEAANLHDVTARYLRLVGDRPPMVMFGPARLASDYPGSEADALKMAFRLNPALRSSVENVESAQHDVEVRRSAFHPKLDLRLRNESTDNYQGVVGSRQNNVAEVVFSYNLFSGGADSARLQAYTDRKAVALDLRDKSCRDIRQTLSIAYNDVQRLKAQLSNLDLQVSSIEKTRDAYKAQFNIGQRSLLDLLDTENELLNARRTSVNADVDLALAYLRTQAGIGRLLEFLGLKRIEEQETPDAHELATIVEAEICPAQAPTNYLVDLQALTARALAMLDPPKAPGKPAAPGPASLPSGPLSFPPPMLAPNVAAAPVAVQSPPVNTQSQATDVAAPAIAAESGKPAIPSPPQSPQDRVAERMAAWEAAWVAKDHAAYLGLYAESFVPADGSSRDDWVKQREKRLTRPDSIQLEVKNLTVKEVSKELLVAEFEQYYRSGRYSDRTMKALQWVRVGGVWLIERETARPLSPDVPVQRGAGK